MTQSARAGQKDFSGPPIGNTALAGHQESGSARRMKAM
ncbi:hypothetical protein SXCC_02069 [Gluconacetobacter sp. SXCC-1]|nr:hypothetical protein SXCC_02069 [Gluconacetobacter sp. SXCC-1]